MNNFEINNTFDALISPIADELLKISDAVDKAAGSKVLFFADFVNILFFHFLYNVASLRLLVTELKSNPMARELGLPAIKFSTLQDGFARFRARTFRQLFMTVLTTTVFMSIPEIQALGTLFLIDGSLFPVMKSIYWADYKEAQQALKLHLAFELNRMLPMEFLISEGKFNEKKFVMSIVQIGVTYVMDRGYFAFYLLAHIVKEQAFFIMRTKENLKFIVTQTLTIADDMPKKMFASATDRLVTLKNDPSGNTYRLIHFSIARTSFLLITNRFDLSTFQVIMCYAYRWQVELIFDFLKNTLNAIHILNYSENGVQVYFYVLLLISLLQLKLRQTCCALVQEKQLSKSVKIEPAKQTDTYSFVKTLGQLLHQYWKISCHWLTTLKNYLTKIFDWSVVYELGKT